MSNNESLVRKYSNSIQKLKKKYADIGVEEEEFKKLYFQSLKDLNCEVLAPKSGHSRRNFFKKKIIFIILIFLIIIYNYKSVYSYIICNMQDYIYPGLRLLRKMSIPFISLFPTLTELYQETCLIQNPFFTVVDMDCWPCSTVDGVKEVLHSEVVHKQQSAPFIYKTEQKKIDLIDLKQLYIMNKRIFDKEHTKILINNKYYFTPENVFGSKEYKDNLYIWKLNNFNIARILRQLVPRPKIVPKFGQSTERFIIIDSKHDSFVIPDTECNYSFLLALKGARSIYLKPAEECKHQCKTFEVTLNKSYLLWYNWWYWRPVVQPSTTNVTFIAHVGSYC